MAVLKIYYEKTAGMVYLYKIGDGNDSFSEVGIVANALHDSWLGKYLKKMEWYDMSDDSTEDMLREIQEFDNEYGK